MQSAMPIAIDTTSGSIRSSRSCARSSAETRSRAVQIDTMAARDSATTYAQKKATSSSRSPARSRAGCTVAAISCRSDGARTRRRTRARYCSRLTMSSRRPHPSRTRASPPSAGLWATARPPNAHKFFSNFFEGRRYEFPRSLSYQNGQEDVKLQYLDDARVDLLVKDFEHGPADRFASPRHCRNISGEASV